MSDANVIWLQLTSSRPYPGRVGHLNRPIGTIDAGVPGDVSVGHNRGINGRVESCALYRSCQACMRLFKPAE